MRGDVVFSKVYKRDRGMRIHKVLKRVCMKESVKKNRFRLTTTAGIDLHRHLRMAGGLFQNWGT